MRRTPRRRDALRCLTATLAALSGLALLDTGLRALPGYVGECVTGLGAVTLVTAVWLFDHVAGRDVEGR